MKNKNNWLVISGIMGFLAVALGAFGAHSLKSILSDDMLKIYQTGIMYHLIHAGILLALTLSSKDFSRSSAFILAGIILFSFSLYIYAVSGITGFAVITPFGGVSLLIGWVMIILDSRENLKSGAR
ncbi:MAG: DUF423 domain-containing protein [Bacteroidota bacterium]|nr:DUF423 domain-containing protein [Bacteroidota bacterium]